MIGRIDEVVLDCTDPGPLAQFWAGVLGGTPQRRTDDWHYLDPPGWTRVAFQRVPEGKVVKNRVHLDISAAPGRPGTPEEIEAEKDRIVALGATVVLKYDEPWGPIRELHYVMRDPEGNEFCIQ